jgi:hypothetical protein
MVGTIDEALERARKKADELRSEAAEAAADAAEQTLVAATGG